MQFLPYSSLIYSNYQIPLDTLVLPYRDKYKNKEVFSIEEFKFRHCIVFYDLKEFRILHALYQGDLFQEYKKLLEINSINEGDSHNVIITTQYMFIVKRRSVFIINYYRMV